MTGPETEKKLSIATEELAMLGNGALGYIREIEPGHAAKLLGPQINVPGDIRLYCLYGADGTPMSISASFEAAFAAAREHELTPVTVH
ncbi:MAG: DUF1150 family protein [Parvibaculaceae bacterium]